MLALLPGLNHHLLKLNSTLNGRKNMYTSIYPQSRELCSTELTPYPFFVALCLSLAAGPGKRRLTLYQLLCTNYHEVLSLTPTSFQSKPTRGNKPARRLKSAHPPGRISGNIPCGVPGTLPASYGLPAPGCHSLSPHIPLWCLSACSAAVPNTTR